MSLQLHKPAKVIILLLISSSAITTHEVYGMPPAPPSGTLHHTSLAPFCKTHATTPHVASITPVASHTDFENNFMSKGFLAESQPSPLTIINVGDPTTEPGIGLLASGWDLTVNASSDITVSAAKKTTDDDKNDFYLSIKRQHPGSLQSVSLQSNDRSTFHLQSVLVKANFGENDEGDDDDIEIIITGYLGGAPVPGAAKTVNLRHDQWTKFDIADIIAFTSIDEFRFTTSAPDTSTLICLSVDDIFVAGGGGVLPLNLLDFNGQENAGEVHLNWTTTQEANTSYFEVQRSTDGSGFTPVGQVPAAGSSQQQHPYSYTDILPRNIAVSPGTAPAWIYRLKMTDKDGNFTYSQIIRISSSSHDASLLVTPNPFRQSITIRLWSADQDQGVFTVSDLNGRPLSVQTMPLQQGSNTITLSSLSQLDKGVYMLCISTRSGKQMVKLLKE